MCGRVALYSPPERFARYLDAALEAEVAVPARWNVPPQSPLFIVHDAPEGRLLEPATWGLIPAWSPTTQLRSTLINARSETVREKPSFRDAYRSGPCVIPLDGYFEWDRHPDRPVQPHYFTRIDGEPLLVAGLTTMWRDPEQPDRPPLTTCVIVTSEPNDDVASIHDRMPVVLERGDVDEWLTALPDARYHLLRPAPVGTLQHVGVDPAVGSVTATGPHLIEPVTVVDNRPATLF
jgi:putative SOS response-associated peptidase YedK